MIYFLQADVKSLLTYYKDYPVSTRDAHILYIDFDQNGEIDATLTLGKNIMRLVGIYPHGTVDVEVQSEHSISKALTRLFTYFEIQLLKQLKRTVDKKLVKNKYTFKK